MRKAYDAAVKDAEALLDTWCGDGRLTARAVFGLFAIAVNASVVRLPGPNKFSK